MRQTKMMEGKPSLGGRVRELRKSRGLSQEALAAEIGISRAHLAKIEGGGDMPGRKTLGAFATYFDVTMDYLESGTPPLGAQSADETFDGPDDIAWARLGRELALHPDQRQAVFDFIRKFTDRSTGDSASRGRRRGKR